MAPLDDMSQPGTASYDSDTMTVGDGTWDFTKNDFLLPNLVGLNFDTMQYNGMGNRFATMPQYHSLVKAHGIIAVIVFLFIVPMAIFYARFYTRRPGYAVRYHAYLNIAAVLLTTAAFVLGWFAVGPKRSLTNPHHGIGVAIYTLILLQIIGGRLVKNIRGRSLRVMMHQWFGRTIALLGIIQVPLGLTLYGSPKYTFVLFAVWMSFLLFLYFIFEYRADDRPDYIVRDGRSEVVRTERKSGGGTLGWLGPLALAGAAWALLRGRDGERSRSRSRSRSRVTRVRSRSRSRSRSRPPEVIPSRHESYVDDEKFTDRYSERPKRNSGGGFMHKVLGVGAGLGAAALISRMMGKRDRRRDDEEYSAVATDTPSRRPRSRSGRRHGGTVVTDYTDESEEYHRGGRRSPLLPGPSRPSTMAAAISAVEARPAASRPVRPVTPQPSHYRGESMMESTLESDYSSYVSPSRRSPIKSRSGHSEVGPVQKGLLAGVGLGWFAKKMRDRRESKEEGRMRAEEEDRRAGRHSPRYTGDGYSTPPRRRDSRHAPMQPAESARTGTSVSHITEEESSLIEPRPLSGYEAHPPLEPLPTGGYRAPATASGTAPPPMGRYAPVGNTSHSRTQSGHNVLGPAAMPPMPADPKGILAGARDSESDSHTSRRDKRRSESRRRAGQDAADAAAASAGMLAAEEEAQRRTERGSSTSRGRTPVGVKVKVHDDKDRNVTLRRLTEEETLAARRARRRRAGSGSSLSGSEAAGGSRSRYRRETNGRRAAEESAESAVEEQLSPLPPPAPAFAGGRRPKDSAYYSGQPPQQTGPAGGPMSSLGSLTSPGSHGTWSGMSPIGTAGTGAAMQPGPSEASAAASVSASAADRRRRRRLERRDGRAAAGGTVDFT